MVPPVTIVSGRRGRRVRGGVHPVGAHGVVYMIVVIGFRWLGADRWGSGR